MGKIVYDLSHRQLDLGLLGLAEFAPALVLVLVVGTVADRFDRRAIVAVAGVGCALVAGALAAYVATRPTAVGPLFGLVVAYGVLVAFANPAARSLPADLVSAEQLPWLVARDSASWQASIVVGPVLGGFLYPVDPRLPFAAVAVLHLASSVLVMTLPRRPHADRPPEPSPSLDGLRFVRRQPVLLGAISLDLFAVLFGGAVALLPAIAKDRLGVGAVGLGWLRAACGIGAGIVAVGLAARPVARRIGPTLFTVVAVFGGFTVLLGVTRNFAVAFVALLVLSGADSMSVFIRATLVPLLTPPDKRGRVLAVENVFIGASNELGGFESGVVGQLLGTSASVVLGGIATLVIAGGWSVLFPALRRLNRFPGGMPEMPDGSEPAAEQAV